MSAKQPVSVLLCCAHSDASHVRPLVGKLEREGTTTRLIEGIEDDPHLFGKALDDSPGATLFVVCLSDTLGTSHYRRLTGVYNARKGPSHYLADIIVEPDELDAMFDAIATALVRAGKVIANPRRDKRQAKHGPAALREVVSVSTISAVDESAARSQSSRSQPAPRKPAPRKSKSKSKFESDPAHDGTPPHQASVSGAYAISTRKADAGARDSSPPAEDSPEPEPTPEPDEAKPRPSTGTSGLGPAVLFVILIAVAVTAMLVLQDREQGDTSASERGIPRPAVIPAESEPAPVPAPTPIEPAPVPTEPAPENPVDEAAVIREAIAAGELRAIDLLLVANPEATANWRDASTACRAKSLHGVRGWRLPSLDELETIRDARMLDRDRYWSGTLATKHGDGSDHVYVLDVAARKLDPVAKDAADVRYLCVRAALP